MPEGLEDTFLPPTELDFKDLKDGDSFDLGGGPTIGIGPNMSHWMAEQLEETAKKLEIPYQLEIIPGTVPNLLHLPVGCSFSPRCAKCGTHCSDVVPELREVSSGHLVRCINIPEVRL